MQTANTEIKAALAELGPLPTPVADWLVETGTDSVDEPAVWVWAVLQNDLAEKALQDWDLIRKTPQADAFLTGLLVIRRIQGWFFSPASRRGALKPRSAPGWPGGGGSSRA